MKKVQLVVGLFVLAFCASAQLGFAQGETGSWQNQTEWSGTNTEVSGDLTQSSPMRTRSAEEIAIENRILEIKKTGIGSKSEVLMLQKQLDAISGVGATIQSSTIPGSVVEEPKNHPPFIQQDAIGNSLIDDTGTKLISDIATFTQQSGTNAGRIWALLAFRTTGSPDSLRLYSSDNDGVNWTLRALANLGGTDRISYDQMDLEVISNGDSVFVWAFYGYRENATGDWRAGGMVIKTNPSFAGSLFAMSWPGTSSNNRYYRPRVTSDNSLYGNNAYLYIVASYDSLITTSRRNGQKYARVLNPYVSSGPTFSYYGPVFFWSTTPADLNLRDLQCDIAYFQNSSDSVITVYSNMRDSTKLFFAKASIGTPNPQSAGGSIGGTQSTDHKQYAKLSTNGNGNGSVYCVFRQNTDGFQVKYFRTTNFGNFNSLNQSVLLPVSGGTAGWPDIVGRRNVDRHYLTFRIDGTPDSAVYYTLSAGGFVDYPNHSVMNGEALITGTLAPKAGFRYANGDSCFIVYADTGPYDLWAATGCTGAITSIQNNQLPAKYSLSQNYPNPFNPSTSIRFEIPKDGLVKIVVYDILGKEVATLVNDKRAAGSYIIDFNAAGLSSGVYFYKLVTNEFTDIKKMTLIK